MSSSRYHSLSSVQEITIITIIYSHMIILVWAHNAAEVSQMLQIYQYANQGLSRLLVFCLPRDTDASLPVGNSAVTVAPVFPGYLKAQQRSDRSFPPIVPLAKLKEEYDLHTETLLGDQAHSDVGDVRRSAATDRISESAVVDTLGLWEEGGEQGEDGRDGGGDECRRYQSQAALLISSRPRRLLTLNDTPVGPMASLRWQHGRPALLKCKSGFNLKQSRLAEIIFLPSSQVLPPPFIFSLPFPPFRLTYTSVSPPSLHTSSFPSPTSLTPGVPEMERASLEEATDKGKGGGGRLGKRGWRRRRKGAAVLTPAFCPDEGAGEQRRRRSPAHRDEDVSRMRKWWTGEWSMEGEVGVHLLPGMTTHNPSPSFCV